MAKHGPNSAVPVLILERPDLVLPTFTFAPFMGRKPLDQLETDFVLMTRLYRQRVPEAMHVEDDSVGSLLKAVLKNDFLGRKDTSLVLEVPLTNSKGASKRHICLVGLGSASGYCGQTACKAFETFITSALERGAECITVPFIPNPMTKTALTHKATAFKLKQTLKRVLSTWQGTVRLKEVQIYCTPAAVRHIREGLAIERADEECRCQ